MKHHCKSLCLLALAAAFFAGCRTTPGTEQRLDTTRFTIESTDKFVLLDRPDEAYVSCTGLQERILPDGRLEVVANVKNRERHLLRVQLNCVFKDEQGSSTGDETPLRNLTLAENTTEAVTFISANNLARRYTIRVRETR